MKIILTIKELINMGLWRDHCESRGWNPYILKEGSISSEEEITLTQKQVDKYLDTLVEKLKQIRGGA
jgi:hypothetical protein